MGNRTRTSMTGIPRLNNNIKNIAGTEMRPSSYAGPHHTIGLPVMSPSSRLNQTLPMSNNSTLERPPRQPLKKSPPPAIPVLNLRPKNNGLLTTIEQAAMSDEEPGSPTIESSQGSTSRIPTPSIQPNYENVTRPSESSPSSLIPVPKKNSLPNDRLSTANFVARKQSADNSYVVRTFATPSPKPPSKIPLPGSHLK